MSFFFSGILDLAEDGGIKVNSNLQTSQKGVFSSQSNELEGTPSPS